MTWAIKIGLGFLAVVILAVSAAFVLQLGPFNSRPSAAAKMIPKVQAAVTKTQVAENKYIAKADTKTQANSIAIEKRTETHVAQIRKTTARAVPADVPDAEFYRGVCASKLYAGAADCRSYGGKP